MARLPGGTGGAHQTHNWSEQAATELGRFRAMLDAVVQQATLRDYPDLIAELERAKVKLYARMMIPESAVPSTAEGQDRLLAIDEAARKLNVSTDYLYRNASKLPFTVRVGRKLLFSTAGIELWIKRRAGHD